MQELGYLIIIVKNQAGITRGYYSEEDFQKLSDWMLKEFTKKCVCISAVYYCPFHLEYGAGKYRFDSFDQKHNPGVIYKARNAFGIQLSKSIFVGDKDSDMEAGRIAGDRKLLLLMGKYPYTNSADVAVCDSIIDVGTHAFLFH